MLCTIYLYPDSSSNSVITDPNCKFCHFSLFLGNSTQCHDHSSIDCANILENTPDIGLVSFCFCPIAMLFHLVAVCMQQFQRILIVLDIVLPVYESAPCVHILAKYVCKVYDFVVPLKSDSILKCSIPNNS